MYPQRIFLLLIFLTAANLFAMKPNGYSNEDTLTLKGKIVKADMKTQKGTKSEGVQDYYFSSGGHSYFIKTAVGEFTKQDLDKIGIKKTIRVKCIKKNGTWDIGSDDPSFAATRTGEYILILELLK